MTDRQVIERLVEGGNARYIDRTTGEVAGFARSNANSLCDAVNAALFAALAPPEVVAANNLYCALSNTSSCTIWSMILDMLLPIRVPTFSASGNPLDTAANSSEMIV